MNADDLKLRAAEAALDLVKPQMKLGLGTGSTAAKFIDLLGARAKSGLDVLCVPTSETTRAQAEAVGLRLTTLEDEPFLDLAIDGADELDRQLRLIKGGGGALLREKIVAAASERMVVIADSSKLVGTIGAFPLPVEVTRFGIRVTHNMIHALAGEAGCRGEITLRRASDGKPFVTENGNLILDCAFGEIGQPELLAEIFSLIPGIVDHGLFLGIADTAFIAGESGVTEITAPEQDEG
ncbi:MAG: ribose-5-phosphate isomerase RpiA [Pseudomonadota bacterium]